METLSRDEARAKAPAWAQAAILAELHQDESELMTDYFAHSRKRTALIGWRKSKRENFKKLREAAALFPETDHLGPGRDDYRVVTVTTEDREFNGSMYWKGHYWTCGELHGKHFQTIEDAQVAIGEADQTLPDYIAYKIECTSIEHRENYSMGAGNYLKCGWHDNGWQVHAVRLAYDCGLPETLEDWTVRAREAVTS